MIGDDYVALFEEAEIRSITGSVIGYSLVSEFYASNVSGDNVYDIFGNEDGIITEDSIVWVIVNKKIWEGREIKVPYCDLPHDSNYQKSDMDYYKWENRVLIQKLLQGIQTKQYSCIKSEIQGWMGYG